MFDAWQWLCGLGVPGVSRARAGMQMQLTFYCSQTHPSGFFFFFFQCADIDCKISAIVTYIVTSSIIQSVSDMIRRGYDDIRR